LSPQQRHLWLVEQSSGSSAFWTECELGIAGDLQPERLMQALARVVERHEVLRTRLQPMPGLLVPVQVVDDQAAPCFSIHDLRDIAPAAWASQLAELRAELRGRPIYGAGAAPLQAVLVRLAPGRS